MPYYIYLVKPFTQLDKLAECETYQEASATAKALRATQTVGVKNKIKVMFADNELQAEELLCEVRIAPPKGDD